MIRTMMVMMMTMRRVTNGDGDDALGVGPTEEERGFESNPFP